MTIVLVGAVALIDGDGRILLAKRRETGFLGGLWEFPGGKLETGETPEETVIRELREELGIETWGNCLAPLTFASHAYDSFHLLMPLFVCRKWKGIPKPLVHESLAWVRAGELRNYPMPPADRPILPILRDWLGG